MNAGLQAQIAANLATLSRVVDAPSEPYGFGSDLSLSSDLTTTMSELRGDDPRVVLEAAARSIQCPTGGLLDDRSYGYDLVGALNRGMTTTQIREVEGRVRTAIVADDRIASATVTATPSPTGSSLTVAIRGVLADPAKTTFSLVLALTSSSALIQEMRTA